MVSLVRLRHLVERALSRLLTADPAAVWDKQHFSDFKNLLEFKIAEHCSGTYKQIPLNGDYSISRKQQQGERGFTYIFWQRIDCFFFGGNMDINLKFPKFDSKKF